MKTNSRVLTTGLLIAALAAPAAPAQAESFATAAALAGDRGGCRPGEESGELT